MSHISIFEAHQERDQVLHTPCPREKGRRVSDFKSAKLATPGPRSFICRPTPTVRKVNAGTDLVAEIEEEQNEESLQGLQNRTWKVYTLSPFFNYDADSSPQALQSFLETKLPQLTTQVEKIKGLRGTREDAECLRISIHEGSSKYFVYFLAVHTQEFELNSHVTAFPLALANATEVLSSQIFQQVEKMFDCRTYKFNLGNEDLKWMSALWAGTLQCTDEDVDSMDAKKDVAKFSFKLPKELQNVGTESVFVTVNGTDLRRIWNV